MMKQGPEVNVKEMLTDPKAIIDSAVPPVLFVGANYFFGLQTAAIVAGAFGVITFIYRIVRREKLQYVVSGMLGLALAIFLALRTKRASSYFLPNTLISAAYGTVFLLSAVIRRPLTVYITKIVESKPAEWYKRKRVRNAHTILTIAWAMFFLGKAGLRWWFITNEHEGQLAASAIYLGFPAFAAMTAGGWAFLRWRLGSEPPPIETIEEGEAVEPETEPD